MKASFKDTNYQKENHNTADITPSNFSHALLQSHDSAQVWNAHF